MVGSCRILFALVAFLGLSSTVLADDDPTDDLRVINISSGDVGALNRAVNDPANVNTVLVLAPGVYNLGPDSQDARNGGRLELQENQFIRGTNRYLIRRGTPVPRDPEGHQYADPATEAILDCSMVAAAGPTGCVVIWRGGTSRVTIRNGATAGALVQVGVSTRASGHSAVIFRTDLVGGQRAFRMQHTRLQAGIASTAVISQSILRDSVGFYAFGWQVQIGGGAAGSSVDVLVKNSTITRTRFGGFVAGLANGATFTVKSEHNLYQDNHAGLELDPARDATAGLGGTSPGFMGNTLDFTTDSDRFVNNGPFSNSTYWPSVGAISAKTAFRTGPMAGQHSNNTMRLTVKDPFFLGNSPADLLAYGAVSLDGGFPQGFPATELAGVNNVLLLSIDAERGGNFIYCDSIPADPAGTNQVISDAPGLVENCSPL